MANISFERGGSDSDLGESDDIPLSFGQYIPEKKRKGSPLTDKPLKKQNSMPDISKLTPKEKKKIPPNTFSDNLKLTLNDSTLSQSITPVLCDMMAPLIQETIKSCVASAIESLKSSILLPILETNKKLQESVNKQEITIQHQQTMLEDQKRQLSVNQDIITELEAENQLLCSELDSLKINVNNLEQYGRRNSLRFNNLTVDTSQKEDDMIHAVVTFINNNMMQNGEKITDRDVERCHPIGRKVRGRKPQIIVKFSSYKTKSKVFSNKTMLKGHGDKTFVTEDLTTQNHQVVKSLLELRKSRKINSFWTSNGKILAKKAQDTSPIQLNFMDNIPSKLGLSDD